MPDVLPVTQSTVLIYEYMVTTVNNNKMVYVRGY